MSNTERWLAANRANALHSTGPITAQGKAIIGRNAIRHGLLSTKLLLDDEDAGTYRASTWQARNVAARSTEHLQRRQMRGIKLHAGSQAFASCQQAGALRVIQRTAPSGR